MSTTRYLRINKYGDFFPALITLVKKKWFRVTFRPGTKGETKLPGFDVDQQYFLFTNNSY